MGTSVEDFFDKLLEESKGGSRLPNWYVVCAPVVPLLNPVL